MVKRNLKLKANRRMSFAEATARYVHRFTMEHVPAWASVQRADGTYYAPHFRTDREWYENTKFPGEPGYIDTGDGSCYTSGQTWPLGKAIHKAPYSIGPAPDVYIFVRGGVVQGVRSTHTVHAVVVDYDGVENAPDEMIERDAMGCTFAELEKKTLPVY